MDSASIGEDLCLAWPAFMQRLFCERAALRELGLEVRKLGLEGCDEIIHEQFKMEQDGRRKGLDFTAWDAKHRQEVAKTIQGLHDIGLDQKDQKKGQKDDLDMQECMKALSQDIHWLDGKID